MNIKSFFDNWEEIFIGACLQFPLYFIVGWWVIPVALVCGVCWRSGGWEFGNKIFRRIVVPGIICLSTFLTLHNWQILLAIPFMTWVAPSYGKGTWLYKTFINLTKNEQKADFFTRIITYLWYWLAFAVALLFGS